ncbi:MAG: hypothetical protein VB018_02555 [Lachnospiraceae bacterium]|nr:hypothetical protein [Lachnospiraceae bacterium]
MRLYMGQGGNGKKVPSVRRTALRSKVLTNAMAKTDAIYSQNNFARQSADHKSLWVSEGKALKGWFF